MAWRTRTRKDASTTQLLDGGTLVATHPTARSAVAHIGRALVAAPLPAPTIAAKGTVWVIPEGVETSDGALVIEPDAIDLSARPEPLPFMWQTETDFGHNGAVLVGRLTNLRREDGGWIVADLEIDDTPEGRAAIEDAVNREGRYGVSADFGVNASEFECTEEVEDDELGTMCVAGIERISAAELLGATGVMFPYFADARVELVEVFDPGTTADVEADPAPGVSEDDADLDGEESLAAALVAAASPPLPPSSWFDDPQLDGPTHLTVTADGRVFGHLATWGTCHIGRDDLCLTAPHTASAYAYFQTGVVDAACDDGCDKGTTVQVPVGALTLRGGHADLHLDAAAAKAHYDDTDSTVAYVTAGEDVHGVWLAGTLRAGTTDEQVRTLMAHDVSGDWRSIGGRLELIAACSVPVAGFPVTRLVASGAVEAGSQVSLVAAGIVHGRPTVDVSALVAKVDRLERREAVRDLTRRIHAGV